MPPHDLTWAVLMWMDMIWHTCITDWTRHDITGDEWSSDRWHGPDMATALYGMTGRLPDDMINMTGDERLSDDMTWRQMRIHQMTLHDSDMIWNGKTEQGLTWNGMALHVTTDDMADHVMTVDMAYHDMTGHETERQVIRCIGPPTYHDMASRQQMRCIMPCRHRMTSHLIPPVMSCHLITCLSMSCRVMACSVMPFHLSSCLSSPVMKKH